MSDKDLAGGIVIAIAPQSLRWAVDTLVDDLGLEMLRRLKVPAGEHLSAILATAFLRTTPSGVDADGGVDLRFDLSRRPGPGMRPVPVLPPGATSVAFEIKSMPGAYRKFAGDIDRDEARGIDTIGRSLETKVRAANDVLSEAAPVLCRAREQLLRKTSANTSRNIFLVMHIFDHLVAECMDPILGPSLDPLEMVDDFDTVWILWPLEHLTVWSNAQRRWTDLLFNAGAPEDVAPSGGMGFLHDAEKQFLDRIDHTHGSPYLFHMSVDVTNPEDE